MKKMVVSVAAVTLLSACGGGSDESSASGGSGGQPSTALSASNYEAAGKEVMGSLSNATSAANLAGFLTGAEVATPVNLSQFLQMKYPQVLKATQQPAYLSGVTVNETESCSDGGFVAFSGFIRSEENPSAGDTVTLTANNCREAGATINGAMLIRILRVAGNIDRYPFSMELETSTNNFRSTTATATYQSTGSLSMNLTLSNDNSQNLTVTIPNMVTSISANGKTETLRYANYRLGLSVRGSTASATIQGGVSLPSLGGNLVTIQTLQPLVSTTQYPSSGSLMATPASGGKMRISATPSQAFIELDANSDGVYEANKSVPWRAIF